MKLYRIITIAAAIFVIQTSSEAAEAEKWNRMSEKDTLSLDSTATVIKKRPWRAAVLTMTLNAGVWLFDRYVRKDNWFDISFKTVENAFKNGFNWEWDYDYYYTNMIGHPYNGSMYFNTARSNGLNYWVSSAYALGGSLIWEYCSENQKPSINDVISTVIGGAALGEVTHRLGNQIADPSKRGGERVAREFMAMVIDPFGGLSRMFSGDMWKVRPYKTDRPENTSDFDMSIGISSRFMYEGTGFLKGTSLVGLNLAADYGDFLERGRKPFETFRMKTAFCIHGAQSFLGRLNLYGNLVTSKSKDIGKNLSMVYGLYQYFSYYDSRPLRGAAKPPVQLSESASVGPGIVIGTHNTEYKWQWSQGFFTGAIMLGASKSDYLLPSKDYNFGSGYSIRSVTDITYYHRFKFRLNLLDFNLYTWKGGTQKELEAGTVRNIMGDRSRARVLLINPVLQIYLKPSLSLDFEAHYFIRKTHYRDYEDVKATVSDTELSLAYHF